MFPFCPHCGNFLEGEQSPGQTVVCKHCGKQVGVVPVAQQAIVIDRSEERIRSGAAANCAACGQLVELKGPTEARTFVPHFVAPPQRKMCRNSGKPVAAPAPAAPPPAAAGAAPARKDLAALMTRDAIRVVSCTKGAPPQIEELTLEYLDKSDRVRIQIEALREILGPRFRMSAYPAALNRPHLAVWATAAALVVGKKHPQGGYQQMTDAEVGEVVADVKQHAALFFLPAS